MNHSPSSPGPDAEPLSIDTPQPPAPARPQRRRLWQLPAEHRSFVVGLGLPPATLRRTAEQALARLHRVRVALGGADADVLASVLCDLGSRNAVAEAVQAQLAQRHAAALARVAPLRTAEALREAWCAALAGGAGADVPGTAWALLTHPLGAALDDGLLIDLRGWAFAQARARAEQVSAESALREAARQARAEADTARLRLQQEQAAWAREREAHARERARLRGEAAAWREAAGRALAAAPGPAATAAAPAPAAVTGASGPAAELNPRALRERAAPGRPRRVLPIVAGHPTGEAAAHPRTDAPRLHGRRVLCVGGMPGAQDRYRRLVETAGAEFDFHDGGLEQGLHRLDRQLGAADLVVCQAACLNHEAYRRVKGHCRRADKTCLFVERPSLAHFARTLGLAGAVA
jgi:hypothetical protein